MNPGLATQAQIMCLLHRLPLGVSPPPCQLCSQMSPTAVSSPQPLLHHPRGWAAPPLLHPAHSPRPALGRASFSPVFL